MNWFQVTTMRCMDCYLVVKEDWYWVKNGKVEDIVFYCGCEEE